MLDSIALISYSRALTKAETSRSPFLFKALSEVWASIFLAFEVLTRLAARFDDWLFESEGCFLLAEGFEAIEEMRWWSQRRCHYLPECNYVENL